MHVAEEAATLDVLSGGNFVLGVGLGYRAGEFGAFGVSLKERAPRFSESIQLMRKLWTEDRVTFDGRFYSVKDHGISLKPHAPGRSSGLGRRAGRSRGEARRAHRRRLADRQRDDARRDGAADADLSRDAARSLARR